MPLSIYSFFFSFYASFHVCLVFVILSISVGYFIFFVGILYSFLFDLGNAHFSTEIWLKHTHFSSILNETHTHTYTTWVCVHWNPFASGAIFRCNRYSSSPYFFNRIFASVEVAAIIRHIYVSICDISWPNTIFRCLAIGGLCTAVIIIIQFHYNSTHVAYVHITAKRKWLSNVKRTEHGTKLRNVRSKATTTTTTATKRKYCYCGIADVARCWNAIYVVLKFKYALKHLKATRPPFWAFLNNCLFVWIAI